MGHAFTTSTQKADAGSPDNLEFYITSQGYTVRLFENRGWRREKIIKV